MKEKMSIMVATDLNYLYPTRVLLTSIMHNHYEECIDVYLLYSGLSSGQVNITKNIVESWKNKNLYPMEIKEEYLNGLKGFGRFSVAAFYRIIGMQLLPESVEKILYLDVDMVVNRNIKEIFDIPVEAPLMACYDINNYFQGNINYHKSYIGLNENENYFNSGMLLIDMNYARVNKTADKLLKDILNNFENYELVDQDALNKYYREKIMYLDWKRYNCPCIVYLSRNEDSFIENEDFYTYVQVNGNKCKKMYDVTENILGNASIIHFCTENKPWNNAELYNADNMKQICKIYKRYEKILQIKMKKCDYKE